MLRKLSSLRTTSRHITFFALLLGILALSAVGVFSGNYGTSQAAPLAAEAVGVITNEQPEPLSQDFDEIEAPQPAVQGSESHCIFLPLLSGGRACYEFP